VRGTGRKARTDAVVVGWHAGQCTWIGPGRCFSASSAASYEP
jgi:hypothetical protein